MTKLSIEVAVVAVAFVTAGCSSPNPFSASNPSYATPSGNLYSAAASDGAHFATPDSKSAERAPTAPPIHTPDKVEPEPMPATGPVK
jgi:hypothetical protein